MHGNMMRGDRHKLEHGNFWLDSGEKITVIIVKHLSSVISKIGESLSLELFKIQQILEQPAHIGPALGRR